MFPAKAEFEAVPRTKLYQKVVKQVQDIIRDGLLRPGDMLPPERELAEQLHVSRGSLREAILALESMGLVEPRHGEGTIVRDLSAAPLVNQLSVMLMQKRALVGELLEFRLMVEPTLAARAAANATEEEIAHLEEILSRQKAKVDHGELAIEEDSKFHYAIAQAARNSVVLKVLDVFMDYLRESRELSLQVEGRPQRSLNSHRRILNAIARKNPAAAEKAMRRHITAIEGLVLKKM
ncbi:MAG TPA: FadR/GntR family transcriptional regulator [Verrucomicrobiae bacterium]|nr:FadR/GntR family transcriptional regulator [Verrucomicrobiae bacterium]